MVALAFIWVLWCVTQDVYLTAGQKLNAYSTASASASSEAVWLGVNHVAQWAIEGSSERSWSACFVSSVETAPWWRLSFHADIDVSNVKIFKLPTTDAPFAIFADSDWEVYVSSGSRLDTQTATRCHSFTNIPTTADFICGANAKGAFLFITATSTVGNERALALCEVVVNTQSVSPDLAGIGATATFGSSGSVTMPANKAIDGIDSNYSLAACPQSGVATNSWLRVDLQKVYLIVGFQLFPYGLDTSGAVIVVGRFPTVDIVSTFHECGRIQYHSVPTDKSDFVFTILCAVPQLAEYIYIVKTGLNSSLAVCELTVYYDTTYNIYSSTKISVSSQSNSWSDPWKAVDGYLGVKNGSCFQSAVEANAWWRLEFQNETEILAVRVLTDTTATALTNLNESAVFVGNKISRNGRDNVQCDRIWSSGSGMISSVMYFHCIQPVKGRYIYVVADNGMNSLSPALTLCEVQLYQPSCQPTVTNMTGALVIQHNGRASLSCHASSCIAVSVNWKDAHGVAVLPVSVSSSGTVVVSVIEVNGTEGGQFTCTASNVLGSHSAVTTVRVIPHIISKTENRTLFYGESQTLSCAALGYPPALIRWTDSNGQAVQAALEGTQGNVVTSTINVTSGSRAEGGGQYKCNASNEVGTIETSSVVYVSAAVIHPPNDLVVSHGQGTTLECMAVGFPPPQISWTGPDAAVSLHSSDTLSGNAITSRLPLVQKGAEAGGEYRCVGLNTVAKVPSIAIVAVYVTPIAVVEPKTQTVVDGKAPTVFQCIGSGYPVPSLSWQWSSFPSDPRIVSSYNITDLVNTVGSNLTLGLVSLSHNNTIYSCNASNSWGHSSALGHLTVNRDIIVTENPKTTCGILGGSVQLSCTASGVSAADVQWRKGNSILTSSKYVIALNKTKTNVTSSLTIKNLQFADVGSDYLCDFGATNFPGLDQSTSAAVFVLGTIESFDNRTLPSGGSSLRPLMCTFTANPQPVAELLFEDGKTMAGMVTSIANNTWTVTAPLGATALQAAGLYTCRISCATGVSVSQIAQLGVLPVISGPDERTVNVQLGGNLSLSCNADGFPVPSLTWKREADIVPAPVVMNQATRTATSLLTLKQVGVAEAGNYSCGAANYIGQTRVYHVVQVSATVTTPSHSVNGSWGGNVSLMCKAMGYPAPVISWMFRGRNLRGTARIVNATHSVNILDRTNLTAATDGGEYICKAVNIAGSESSSSVILLLEPRVTIRPVSQDAVYGTSVHFLCQVSAYPPVDKDVMWYKDGRLVDNAVSADVLLHNGVVRSSSLTIHNVTEMDCGAYSCYRSLESSANIRLNSRIVDPPQPPANGVLIHGQSLSLSCVAVGCPNANITWYVSTTGQEGSYVQLLNGIWSMPMGGTTISFLNISSVTRLNTNYYSCYAYNGIGTAANATVYVNVYAPPTILSVVVEGLMSDIAFAGDSVKLHCFASGVPIPAIIWQKDGQVVKVGTRIQVKENKAVAQSISGQVVDIVSTLYISDLLLTDEGTYECHANSSGVGLAVMNVTMTVRGAYDQIFHCSASPQLWPLSCSNVSNPLRPAVPLDVSPNVLSLSSSPADPISVYWNGWTCFRPVECRNIRYLWRVYSVAEPHEGQEYLVAPENALILIKLQETSSLHVHPSAGLHLVELVVEATNLTSAVTRQLILVDDSSHIEAMPGSSLRFSANPATNYVWYTGKDPSVLTVTWGDGYYNTYIKSKPWLLYPIRELESGNNVDTPPLSFNGNPTLNNSGIKTYTLSLYMKSNGSEKLLSEAVLDNYTLAYSHSAALVTNKEYCAELVIEDIFQHRRIVGATAYSDFTLPEIGNISIWRRSNPSIVDPLVCARRASSSYSLEFVAMDEESGIMRTEWLVGNEGQTAYPANVSKVACHAPFCHCSLDSHCALQQFAISLGSILNGTFNVSVTAWSRSYQSQSKAVQISNSSVRGEDVVPRLHSVNSKLSNSLTVRWSASSAIHSTVVIIVCQRPRCESCQELPATEAETLVTGLKPYTDYVVQIKEERNGEFGLSASMNATTLQEAPNSPPRSVSVSPQSPTDVLLTWLPPLDGTHNGIIETYTVNVFEDISLQPFQSIPVTAPLHQIRVANLNPNRLYRFSVAASTAGGLGNFSQPMTIRMPEAAPDDWPQNVTLLDKMAASLTFGWQVPPVDSRNGVIRGYIIDYSQISGNTNTTSLNVSSGQQLNYTIDKLEPFTQYRVQIKAYTLIGEGPHSPEIVKQTGESTPGSPLLTHADPLGTMAIFVIWSGPLETNGVIVNYTIVITQLSSSTRERIADGSGSLIVQVEPQKFSYSVRGLTADTSYNVSMFAETSKGRGKSSKAILVQTPKIIPGAPQSLKAVPLNSTVAMISWLPPITGNPVSRYYISISDHDSGDKIMSPIKWQSNTSVLVDQLEPYTYYEIQVASHNSSNDSAAMTFIRMLEDTPGQVTVFSVVSVDDSSAVLRWMAPEHPNGRISYQYTVRMISTGEEIPGPRLDPGSLQVDDDGLFYRRITQLEGDTEFAFSIQAYNILLDRNGPASRWKTVRTLIGFPGPCGEVVTFRGRQPGSISVFWETPERPNGPIDGYTVTAAWIQGTDMRPPAVTLQIETDSTVDKMLTIPGLQQGSRYEITVRARNVKGLGVPSSKTISVSDAGTHPMAPINVTEFNRTSMGFSVMWDPPSQPANLLGYLVVVTDVIGNNIIETLNGSNATHTVAIDGLQSYTLYGVAVEAKYQLGGVVRVSSDLLPVQTLQGAPSLPPSSFIVKPKNSSTLCLDWLSPPKDSLNGELCAFVATYVESDTNIADKQSFGARVNSGCIKNLNPCTNYSVSLAAKTCVDPGVGPAVTEYSRTAESVPDRPVIDAQVTSNSISLAWAVDTNCQLISVVLTIAGSIGSNRDDIKLMSLGDSNRLIDTTLHLMTSRWERRATPDQPGNSGNHVWIGLEAYTSYSITVQARTRAGAGDVAAHTYQTSETKPSGAPNILHCEAVPSSDDILLTINYESIQSMEWNSMPGHYDVVIQYGNKTIKEIESLLESTIIIPLSPSDFNESSVYQVTMAGVNSKGRGPFAKPPCNFEIPMNVSHLLPSGSSSDTATIVVAVIVPITVLVVLAIMLFIWWKKSQSPATDYSGSTQLGPGYFDLQTKHWLLEWPDYDEFQVDRDKIKVIRELGEGEFGKVFLASAEGIIPGEETTQVAVKTMKKGSSRETAEDFRKEMDIMMEFDHPHIIKLLGVCTKDEPLYIITELMSKGDLKEFVRKARASDTNPVPGLTLYQLLDICTQLSSGMEYLASQRFVHRDVAARNCLVGDRDNKLVAKVADFGMAKDVYQSDYYKKRGGILPIRWMAPEAITDGRHTLNSDIWSFGVLMWEVFSFGYQPYFGIENDRVLGGVIQGSLRLQCPSGCPAQVFNVIQRCWEKKAADRIKASDLVVEMKKLRQLCEDQGPDALKEMPDRYQGLKTVQTQMQLLAQDKHAPDKVVGPSYTNVATDGDGKPTVTEVPISTVSTTAYIEMNPETSHANAASGVEHIMSTPSYVPMYGDPTATLPTADRLTAGQHADLQKQVASEPNQYDEMPSGVTPNVCNSPEILTGHPMQNDGDSPRDAPYTNILPDATLQSQSMGEIVTKARPHSADHDLPIAIPSPLDEAKSKQYVETAGVPLHATATPTRSGQTSYVNVDLSIDESSV